MHKVRIKICGITRPEDALKAAELGADAIGLVFYPKSPRAIDRVKAQQIISVLPPFISKIGLFVNSGRDSIQKILDEVPLDMLQFHGDEPPEECRCYAIPYLKAVRMQAGVDVHGIAEKYFDAAGLLLDSYIDGLAGGTGSQFDWRMVPADLAKPLIIAGGLHQDNVAEAIRMTHPYAVDVSGGVESARGIKDPDKMAKFMEQVWNA
jgi:phosphoribosylanthranilate isomerase